MALSRGLDLWRRRIGLAIASSSLALGAATGFVIVLVAWAFLADRVSIETRQTDGTWSLRGQVDDPSIQLPVRQSA